MKVAVVGATGQTGGSVIDALAANDHEVTAVTRRAEHGDAVRARGADRVAVADPRQEAQLADALRGIDAVYVIPPTFVADEHLVTGTVVRAAADAGVSRVVMHSVLHPSTSTLHHHLRKAHAEEMIRSTQLEWVILQPAMYAQAVLSYRAVSPPGKLISPWSSDAPLSVVDLTDIAIVAARAVADPAMAYGTFEIAGPQQLSMRDMAGELFDSGQPLDVVEVTPEDLSAPPTWTDDMKSTFVAMCHEYDRHGLIGSPLVAETLLGRPATPFARVVGSLR